MGFPGPIGLFEAIIKACEVPPKKKKANLALDDGDGMEWVDKVLLLGAAFFFVAVWVKM